MTGFKNINGEQYRFVDQHTRKSDAQIQARRQRKRGYYVRVIKSGIWYNVWQRK